MRTKHIHPPKGNTMFNRKTTGIIAATTIATITYLSIRIAELKTETKQYESLVADMDNANNEANVFIAKMMSYTSSEDHEVFTSVMDRIDSDS